MGLLPLRLRSIAQRQPQLGYWLWLLLLTIVVWVVYLPSLRFGLIWDDPLWYQRGAGHSLWQIITAADVYQFYRPATVLFNRALVSPSGVVNAELAHLIQIVIHLAATWVCLPVLRALGITGWSARLAALFFAIFPLAYQAVAWQAPQQPRAMLGVLGALWLAHRYQLTGRVLWLGVSYGLYALALLTQESALPFVMIFGWLAWWGADANPVRRYWPIGHGVVVTLYLLIWFNMPRVSGITGAGFDLRSLAYLWQGVVFPLAQVFGPVAAHWPLEVLLGAYGLALLSGVVAVARLAGWRVALCLTLWLSGSLGLMWAGLSWDYMQVGERVLYPSAFGIAAGWGIIAASVFSARGWRRLVGGLVWGWVLLTSANQLWQLNQLYARGTAHLQAAAQALAAHPDEPALFVNFPDRIELRPALYPLGFWGLTLAPVVQNLSDYAKEILGASASDQSLTTFWEGTPDRDRWLYRVDMRGVRRSSAELFAAARQAERVYLSDYLLDGTLRLRLVGAVQAATQPASGLAVWDTNVTLLAAQLQPEAQTLKMRLQWQVTDTVPANTAIFVHLWQADQFIKGDDGDSLGNLVVLADWQAGTVIIDQRQLMLADLPPGVYVVRLGLYNRLSGVRLPVTTSSLATHDNAVQLGEFQWPP